MPVLFSNSKMVSLASTDEGLGSLHVLDDADLMDVDSFLDLPKTMDDAYMGCGTNSLMSALLSTHNNHQLEEDEQFALFGNMSQQKRHYNGHHQNHYASGGSSQQLLLNGNCNNNMPAAADAIKDEMDDVFMAQLPPGNVAAYHTNYRHSQQQQHQQQQYHQEFYSNHSKNLHLHHHQQQQQVVMTTRQHSTSGDDGASNATTGELLSSPDSYSSSNHALHYAPGEGESDNNNNANNIRYECIEHELALALDAGDSAMLESGNSYLCRSALVQQEQMRNDGYSQRLSRPGGHQGHLAKAFNGSVLSAALLGKTLSSSATTAKHATSNNLSQNLSSTLPPAGSSRSATSSSHADSCSPSSSSSSDSGSINNNADMYSNHSMSASSSPAPFTAATLSSVPGKIATPNVLKTLPLTPPASDGEYWSTQQQHQTGSGLASAALHSPHLSALLLTSASSQVTATPSTSRSALDGDASSRALTVRVRTTTAAAPAPAATQSDSSIVQNSRPHPVVVRNGGVRKICHQPPPPTMATRGDAVQKIVPNCCGACCAPSSSSTVQHNNNLNGAKRLKRLVAVPATMATTNTSVKTEPAIVSSGTTLPTKGAANTSGIKTAGGNNTKLANRNMGAANNNKAVLPGSGLPVKPTAKQTEGTLIPITSRKTSGGGKNKTMTGAKLTRKLSSSSISSCSATLISAISNGIQLDDNGNLLLTEEERRTLVTEGFPVPSKTPLSKSEERALKKIRRKIKNKISAQESRRKKKEYVDTLEKRLELLHGENDELRERLTSAEDANQSLSEQVGKIQMLLRGKITLTNVKITHDASALLTAVAAGTTNSTSPNCFDTTTNDNQTQQPAKSTLPPTALAAGDKLLAPKLNTLAKRLS